MGDATDQSRGSTAPRLSADQAAAVFKRAAELDAEMKADGQGFDPAELESIGAEVGLEPEAIRRAIAEIQRPAPPADVGPRDVVLTRQVPGQAAEVQTQIHRFLANQGYELQRRQGGSTVWVRGSSRAATGPAAMSGAVELRAEAVPSGDGVEVRFLLRPVRRSPIAAINAALLCLVAVLVIGNVFFIGGFGLPPAVLVVAIFIVGRRVLTGTGDRAPSAERDAAVVQSFLDWLEHRS
jgi:hypothetical protein